MAAFDAPPADGVRETLRAPDVRIVTGDEVLAALADCDVVVRSPGVSIHRPELRALREAGTPVTTATALWLAERGGEGVHRRDRHEGQEHHRGARLAISRARPGARRSWRATSACRRSTCSTASRPR